MTVPDLVLAELRTAAAPASDKLATNIFGYDVGENNFYIYGAFRRPLY